MELKPISGSSVWSADEVLDREMWTRPLPLEVAEELATGRASAQTAIREADYVRAEITQGRGFLVVLGFPVSSEEVAQRSFLRFGGLLGDVKPQNRQGDVLGLVRVEMGGNARGARTNQSLLYHTDTNFTIPTPAIVGLLAVRAAERGGESLVISAHAVHNVLLEHKPKALSRLYEPFYFDRSDYVLQNESPVFEAPIFAQRASSVAMTCNRARIHRGYRLAGRKLEARDVDALDDLDQLLIGKEGQFAARFTLLPGMALFANNLATVHNRTAFSNGSDGAGRLLLRMWIDPSTDPG